MMPRVLPLFLSARQTNHWETSFYVFNRVANDKIHWISYQAAGTGIIRS